MPKTIAITPSWYWPSGVTRVAGVPPLRLDEALVERWARHRPDDVALVDADQALTGRQLARRVADVARALRARVGPDDRALLVAGPSVDGVVLLLSLARAGVPALLVPPAGGPEPPPGPGPGARFCCTDRAGADDAAASGLPVVTVDHLAGGGSAGADGVAGTGSDGTAHPGGGTGTEDVAAAGVGGVAPGGDRSRGIVGFPAAGTSAWHSHRSLLGGAVSVQTFLGVDARRPWLSTLPVSTWGGVYAVAVPLFAGTTVVLAPPGEAAVDVIARDGVGTSVWRLGDAFTATREAKRRVKSVRGVQEQVVLLADGPFDPDERRRVGRSFDAPALTMFGLPETGPVFASHPSWYLDESIGIPITNAWVVPVDPRSGKPIPTLWELVESAMVTVSSPSLLVGYEGGAHGERFRDGRFATGVIASSDANGMIYLLPD